MTAAYCAAPVTQPMRLSNASLDVQRYPICRNLRNLWDNMNRAAEQPEPNPLREGLSTRPVPQPCNIVRSEEHTSELQSRFDLVCRLLLEKKKNKQLTGST